MVHAKNRRRAQTRTKARDERRKNGPLETAHVKAADLGARKRAGLTEREARLRFRLRTLGECAVYVASWLTLVLVTLPMDRQAIDIADLPRMTATAVADPASDSGMGLQVKMPVPDPENVNLPVVVPVDDSYHYKVGQQVQILGPDCAWQPADGLDSGLAGMVVTIGVLPALGLAFLVFLRVRRWRGLVAAGSLGPPPGLKTWLYETSWRTFVAVEDKFQTYYVPVMRGQGLDALNSLESVQPLVWPGFGVHVPFRVAGTDRVVWPIGGCHKSVWPVGRIALTVGRMVVPVLLVPLTQWIHTSLPPC